MNYNDEFRPVIKHAILLLLSIDCRPDYELREELRKLFLSHFDFGADTPTDYDINLSLTSLLASGDITGAIGVEFDIVD